MLWKHARTIIISTTVVLAVFGIMMIASNDLTKAHTDVSWWRLRWFYQTVWVFLGVIVVFVMLHVPTNLYRRLVIPIWAGSILLLLLALSPLGINAGGADRWIGYGPLRIQPSEVAKLGLIVFVAHFLSSKERYLHYFRSLLPLFAAAGVMMLLVLVAPDMGTTLVMFAILATMLYVSKVPKVFLFGLGCIAFPLVFMVAAVADYRLDRILSFLNPWADPTGTGYQSIQAAIAFARGGLWGVGFTQSLQKFYYLPESQTDFAFAIVGEEFGLIGTALVVLAFLVLWFAGLTVAMKCNDSYRSLLSVGATSIICLPAILNVCIATGLLPISGMPLPFISYGGSSLLVSMSAIGLLLRIDRETTLGQTV